MKAIIWTEYGTPEVLKLREVQKPVPKDNEILVKVCAATVTAGDCEMRRFDLAGWIALPIRLYMGILKPRIKILGQEMSGVVESVGDKVTRFKKGDRVFGENGMKFGGYAEYVCLNATRAISIVPEGLKCEEAATLPTGGINALHFLRKGKVGAGTTVLINGAGGSIGTYAVQLAKLYGAEVSCVDSGTKLDMLQSIGADHVIDYKIEDFTKNNKMYDVIIDIVGTCSYTRTVRSLSPQGYYILGNPKFTGMMRSIWSSISSDKHVVVALAGATEIDFDYLTQLMVDGKIKTVIDRRYQLENMVDAHQYVEKGLKQGNVIITICDEKGP